MKVKKIFIIAEAGVNHNGSLKLALKLVDEAKKAGADAIKFQTWKTDNVIRKNTKLAEYQKKNNEFDNQYDLLKNLELPYEAFDVIKKYSNKKKIKFLSTADEIESAIFLKKIQNIFKIGSAELTDLPFLSKIAKFKKNIILSTGLSTFKEIKIALKILMQNGLKKNKITILHCNSAYPTPLKDMNLNVIKSLKEKFKIKVGLSDHSKSLIAPIIAVSLGATVIEKHFTLNNKKKGPDHSMSLNPKNFRLMVKNIRQAEEMFGVSEKKITNSEKINKNLIRKSIVAQKKIKKGDIFSDINLTVKRPGYGISPLFWNKIIKKKSKRNYEIDEYIKEKI